MVKNYELLESKVTDPYIREALRRIRLTLKDLEVTAGNISNIRNTIINEIEASDVGKMVFEKIAASNISAFQMVRLTSTTEVDLTDDATYEESIAVGIALESKLAGQKIRVLTFAIAEDPSFTWAINAKLFLGPSGSITDTPTTTVSKFVTPIGQSLGPGAIFIRIDEPEEVT